LRSRFQTAPTIANSVRHTYRKTPATTIRYSTGGLSFAQVATEGEPSPAAASTPEGKKRRKENTVISEPGIISNPTADITAELRNTVTKITELMSTLRQEVEEKITALTMQVQLLQNRMSITTEPTQQPPEQATLERTVQSAVAAAFAAAAEKTTDITALLRDRDTRIYDEIQGLRDNLSEMSQQNRTAQLKTSAKPKDPTDNPKTATYTPPPREKYYTPTRRKGQQTTPQKNATYINYAFSDGEPPN
jgi:Tfp pilus assembly major pilin PilA